MKTPLNLRLTAAVGAIALFTGVASVNASVINQIDIDKITQSATPQELAAADKFELVMLPEETLLTNRASDTTYLVRLTDPSVATYQGGIAGYAATSAKATGAERLDTNSAASRKYERRLKKVQRAVLEKAGRAFGRNLATKYDYQHAINGFAIELTESEAKTLGKMEGVSSVQRERAERILTDVGPQWIEAPAIWEAKKNGSMGEDLVIAVLDSGINSDHPSFAAVGGDGYVHTNPLGSGNYLPGSYCDTVDPTFCNDKLIGAWDMTAIDGTVP